MAHEVVVVGGGIGGLTVAALLAARGVDVCLCERESNVGGCVAPFEKFGYTFEPGAGLYALWQPGQIHDRVFAELPVAAPETTLLDPAYVVRLPDRSEITITTNSEQFDAHLRAAFPECAPQAINFYRTIRPIAEALLQVLERMPDFRIAPRWKQLYSLLPQRAAAARTLSALSHTTLQHLSGTSLRFQRFIDIQLQALTQTAAEDCAYLYACVALTVSQQGLFTIRGGAAGLAATLVESIKRSGGKIRLTTPVLRLAYDQSGKAIGVDLLTGERIHASRAVISNLTVWDTYGKLIGLNKTPTRIRKRLASLEGWGAYLIYLGLSEETVRRLPAEHILALAAWPENGKYDPEPFQLTFAAAPQSDSRAPANRRACTVHVFTRVDEWFRFHEDHLEHDRQDQQMLETCWQRLYQALPELGSDVDVIDTATPLTCYELTRRKLGMVGGIGQALANFGPNSFTHRTSIPNVLMVGDTTFPGTGIAAVTYSALNAANDLTS